MQQADTYANKIIDELCITQLTIKELKSLIKEAWLTGYKAKESEILSDFNDNNESSPSVIEQDGTFINEDDLKKIIEERRKRENPPYSPNIKWPPYIPPEPYTYPGNTPWLPIIYC